MLSPIEVSNLAALPGIRHGFFTREGGISTGIYQGLNCGRGSGDVPEHVVENRTRVARYLGARPAEIATPYQVHGATAVVLD
ncbi:MAG: polyphenol oxidase family protein, partial [Alphaproteobacteria bacterium]|nr:polyphenol oxidase family protein [Alphaproteobacteria bacterium]